MQHPVSPGRALKVTVAMVRMQPGVTESNTDCCFRGNTSFEYAKDISPTALPYLEHAWGS